MKLIRPSVRRTIESIKAITDPVEHVLAAAEYFSLPPMALPATFTPDAALLGGKSAEY